MFFLQASINTATKLRKICHLILETSWITAIKLLDLRHKLKFAFFFFKAIAQIVKQILKCSGTFIHWLKWSTIKNYSTLVYCNQLIEILKRYLELHLLYFLQIQNQIKSTSIKMTNLVVHQKPRLHRKSQKFDFVYISQGLYLNNNYVFISSK